MARPLPMFPLGTVLFPHAVLPLHIFEERYRALVETCLRGDGRFGVVLIERGYEVGGGDSRFGVGTVARIVEAARTPDGRYLLATVGTDRFRIKKWLDDDPFPRAEIDVIGEPKRVADDAADAPPRGAATPRSGAGDERGARRTRRAGRRRAARRRPAARRRSRPPRSRPSARSTPNGCSSSTIPAQRFDQLEELLVDAAEVLELRLAGG